MNLISKNKVLPSGPENAEILLIGEAPGYEEDISGTPFIGDAGQLLNQALSVAGFDRNAIRVTNICNYRPNNNKFDILLESPQLQEGIDEARRFIASHATTLKFVILAGGKPLEYLVRKRGIEKWRGSVIEQDGIKYFCSYHPSAIVRDRALYGTFTFDLRKVYRYYNEGYIRPVNNFSIDPKGLELEECLREIEDAGQCSCDIEGVKGSTKILCIGFGLSPSRAIVLGSSNFMEMDLTLYSSAKRILENPEIRKEFQNGFGYDVEVLRLNGINVVNYSFDTMIAAHCIEPEMPYGLDYLTTIYTDRSYYKDKGRSAIPDDDDKGWGEKVDKGVIYNYNAEDCVTQWEVGDKQKKELGEFKLWDTYRYKHSLIPLSQELSRSGMEIDLNRKELFRSAVKLKWKYYQEILNAIAGYSVNVKSSKDMTKLLLKDFSLPERRNRNAGITFDEDAIVSYLGFIQDKVNGSVREATIESWSMRLAACKCILLVRGFRQLLSNYINIKYSVDGRIRSVYNLSAATETGRGSSHKWIDGTGNNAQTWPREHLQLDEKEVEILRGKGLVI